MRPTDLQYTKEHEWIRKVGDDYAISPDGEIVAVQYDDGSGNEPEVVLVELGTGLIISRLGPGTVSRLVPLPPMKSTGFPASSRSIAERGASTDHCSTASGAPK